MKNSENYVTITESDILRYNTELNFQLKFKYLLLKAVTFAFFWNTHLYSTDKTALKRYDMLKLWNTKGLPEKERDVCRMEVKSCTMQNMRYRYFYCF